MVGPLVHPVSATVHLSLTLSHPCPVTSYDMTVETTSVVILQITGIITSTVAILLNMVASENFVDTSIDHIDHLGDDVDHGADVEADPSDPVQDKDGAEHLVVVPVYVGHCVWGLRHPGPYLSTQYGNIVPRYPDTNIHYNDINREIHR